MAALSKEKQKKLQEIRDGIDNIDDQIVELLSQRTELVRSAGKLKDLRNSKYSIIRPGREAEMIRRIAAKEETHIPDSIRAVLWRMLISAAIAIEEENARISAVSFRDSNECFWLAREYFGAFTPVSQRPTTMEVVQDILDQHATVGVLPIWDEDSPRPWWIKLVESSDAPKIFTRLPFVKLAPSQKTPVVGVGYVEPEATGNDESLWVIVTDEIIGYDLVEKHLDGCNLEYELHGKYRALGNPTKHYYLFLFKDYIDESSPIIKNYLKSINAAHNSIVQVSACFLGAYARPLELY